MRKEEEEEGGRGGDHIPVEELQQEREWDIDLKGSSAIDEHGHRHEADLLKEYSMKGQRSMVAIIII